MPDSDVEIRQLAKAKSADLSAQNDFISGKIVHPDALTSNIHRLTMKL